MKSVILLAIIFLYGRVECQNITTVLTDLGCTSLLEALENADLIDELDTLGNVTLFAPTNEALANAGPLPTDAELVSLLEYHATNSEISSAQIENDLLVESLTGSGIRFNIYNDGATFTAQGAQIDLGTVDTNVTNGKVHVLNSVMTPPTGTIYDYLNENPASFSTILAALEQLNATDLLNGTDSVTIFAPNNDAFSNIPAADLSEMLDNTTYLSLILDYHVAQGTYYSAGLSNGDNIPTVRGDNLIVAVSDNGIYLQEVDYSQVVQADVSVTNGVLHVIDRVVDMPKMSGSNNLSPLAGLALVCLTLVLASVGY